ncbi:hypothetical protein Tco_0747480 [Tanacetum coccineum]|uniref:Uncharacterized protein n=1 Tax=Tanacetum coccineum TaxID=301880 RepID=A0ABQ4YSY7_9ASTR
MVAYLERTDRNADIHEIVDFLTTSLIYYALTVCPTIYASYIKQFWNTTHSQTVNYVKQINATVDGKTVVISESSVRSDLHFNDEDEQIPVTESSSPQNTQTPRQALQEDTQLPQTSVPIPNVVDGVVFKEWDGIVEISSGDRPRGYTLRSDEGRPDLHELMAICTKLSDRVLDLEKEKDAQAMEILKLKNRIKKLERKAKSSIPPPKRKLYKQVDSSDDSLGEVNASKQGRNDNNKTEDFNLSNKGSGGTKVFDDTTTAKKDVNAAEPVSTASDAITAASVIPDTNIVGPSNVSVAGPSTKQRITRERAAEQEAKDAALIAEFDNVQARIEADALLAVDTHSQLKNKSLDEIQKLYEREQKWINDFVPMDSEEGGKKLEDTTEKEGLKAYLKIVPNEDIAINYETLATKYPIIDWESQIIGSDLQGNNLRYWKITRADGSSKFYKVFSMMLKDFNKQDLVDFHKLVKERSVSRALEGYDLILWDNLKTMFEPSEEDDVWRYQQDWSLISLKLYETCGVHTLLMDGTLICINMLVEQKYPLTQEILTRILNYRLEANFENEMAYELIKFVKS